MEHIMHLNPSPFSKIKEGTKTIELRLYDEKRREISVDDVIRFICNDGSEETLLARVVELYVFDSFKALYKALPLLSCGYSREKLAQADAADMEQYYSLEAQKQYGVVGICISLLEEPLSEDEE